MAEQTQNKPKLNATQIILIAGIVVIAAAVIFVGVFVLGKPAASPEPEALVLGNGNVVLDEQNAANVIDELNRKAREGMFEVKMNAVWNFPDGKSPSSDAYSANSNANRLPIYFDVALEDGTVIYTSPEIPVGSAVKDIVLDQPIEAGEYECVCTYHLLNEDKTEHSSVSVVVRLSVAA